MFSSRRHQLLYIILSDSKLCDCIHQQHGAQVLYNTCKAHVGIKEDT